MGYEANPQLTGVALSYKNEKFIADKIFKKVPVYTQSFQYDVYNKSLNLQLPDTYIGKTGRPNEVTFASARKTASVRGDSLEVHIPLVDITEAKAEGENLKTRKTEFLANVFDACREKRIADMLQDGNNYDGNVLKLKDSEKFTVENVNAFNVIDTAMDKVWIKPNVMIGSRKAINALRKNPFVVKAANKNSGDSGKATIQDLKEMFELDEVLVGESVVNTARRGQTPNYVGAWGNAIILAYIAPTAALDGVMTFGFTAELGKREISTFEDKERGVRGVFSVKIAEETGDVICAPDCGYLITNVA